MFGLFYFSRIEETYTYIYIYRNSIFDFKLHRV